MLGSPQAAAYLPAANFTRGPVPKAGIGLHSLECPPRAGMARSLSGPDYFQRATTQASVAYVVGGDETIQTAPEDAWTWSAGTPGSRPLIHIEMTGYASMSRDQWLGNLTAVGSTIRTPAGQYIAYDRQMADYCSAMYQRTARLTADICTRWGWQPVAGTAAELRAAVAGTNVGRCFRHSDITAWVGGTTHTDPGPDYPWHELLWQAGQYMTGSGGAAPTPTGVLMALTDTEQSELLQLARNISSLLVVPGFPFGYPEATHNAVGALIGMVGAQKVAGGSVDVKALADQLKRTLAPEIAAELSRRLAS